MITRIILNNYRSYGTLDKSFSDGLNIIQGRNATGKSTIVEAIGYALQGNTLQKGQANAWIKSHETSGSVTLYIDDFIVIRGNRKQMVKDIEGNILARGHTGINEWVLDTYGLSPELYKTSFHIAQKEIEAFTALSPMEKTRQVEKLLRLDVIDDIKQEVQLKYRDTANSYSVIESIISGLEEYTELDLNKVKSDIKLVNKDLDVLLKEELAQAGVIASHNMAMNLYSKKLALEKRLLNDSMSMDDLKTKIVESEDLKIKNAEVARMKKLYDEKINLLKILQNVDIQEKYFTKSLDYCMNLKINIKKSNLAKNRLKAFSTEELALKKSTDDYKTIDNLRANIISLKNDLKALVVRPKICPTCGQDMPNVSDVNLKIEELKVEIDRLESEFNLREKALIITELRDSIILSKYTLQDVDTMIESIRLKDKYLRLQELKDVDKPKESIVSLSYLESVITDCKHDLDIRSRLEEYADIKKPEAIDFIDFKPKIANLLSLDKKLNKELNNIEHTIKIRGENQIKLDELKDSKENLQEFLKFIAAYRKAFSTKISPMIEENANKIVNYLSEGKVTKLHLDQSYNLKDYDLYSGSEEDSANFAIRLAIAQISRLGQYNTMILDEIASSFDSIREDKLIEVLKATDMQIIYISHGDISY